MESKKIEHNEVMVKTVSTLKIKNKNHPLNVAIVIVTW